MVAQSYYLRDPRVRREAEALQESGFQVDVVTLEARGERRCETKNGVRIYRVPLSRRRGGKARYVFEYLAFFILATFYVNLLYLRRRYRALYVHTMPDFLVFCGVSQKLVGRPVILDAHEPIPEFFCEKYGLLQSHWLTRFLEWVERISFSFADHVFTVSDPVRDLFVSRGLNPEKVSVVLNVPDERVFSSAVARSNSAKRPYGSLRLIYTGTVATRYGLDLLLDAVAIIGDRIPGLSVTIVGEGDALPALKEQSRALGLENRVRFLNPVPIEDIPDLIAKADVGVSPHRDGIFWRYYFSTKVVEFLRMGKPVICADTATIRHYFSDNQLVYFKAGSSEDLAEKILELHNTSASIFRNAAENKEAMRNFSWRRHKKHYVDRVRKVVGSDHE
ncbi:MAG: glycosyltransferase family 4 protein [Acidobacteriota bacterium]